MTAANDALLQLFDCASFAELLELPGCRGIPCFWLASVSAALRDGLDATAFEVPTTAKDGGVIWLSIHATLVRENNGAGCSLHGSVRNITCRKIRDLELENLAKLAVRDPLTGLFNRGTFIEALEKASSEGAQHEGFAVLFVDLDRFKEINDSLGHQIGDELLRSVAARLSRFTLSDDILARYGGDEFVMLLSRAEIEADSSCIARAIIEELTTPVQIGRFQLYCSASIGIAFGRSGGGAPEEVLRNADIAMYRAKSEGRASYAVFDPVAEHETLERLVLERDLRLAISSGQLTLEYEPVISLRTGRVAALEAFVNWTHPSRGPIPAARFVALAEECGLVPNLQEWVLQRACMDAASWRQAGDGAGHAKVSVTLSLSYFRGGILARMVESALHRAGLAAGLLRLQIAESALLREPEETIAALSALRSAGVQVMIDDFGGGHSSLRSVLRLHVDAARIEEGAISAIAEQPEMLKVVNALTALGHALGLAVKAGGISSLEQLMAIRGLDVDAAQGPFLAAARSAVSVLELLRMEALIAQRCDRLALEFEGSLSRETVERLLFESLPQLSAAMANNDPEIVETFARQRLSAIFETQGRLSREALSVLFVCVHNAGRSQMAAAFAAAGGGAFLRVQSAGSRPADRINPVVRQAMEEAGFELNHCFPKPLTAELVQAADIIITMGCGDACPIFPGKRYEDWKLTDPANVTLQAARLIRDEVRQHVDTLIHDLLPK